MIKGGEWKNFGKNLANDDELNVNLKQQVVEEPYGRVLGLSSIENIPSVRAWNQRVEAAAAADSTSSRSSSSSRSSKT